MLLSPGSLPFMYRFVLVNINIYQVLYFMYREVSNIWRTLVGNKIVDHYIFILDFTPSFNGLGKDNYKMRRETFKFWELVRLILETWR